MNFNLNNGFSGMGRMVLLASVCMAAGLVGCSHSASPSGDSKTASAATGTVLKEAVFAKALTKDNAPEHPSKDFTPDETVCLSLTLNGRPKTGVVLAKFYYEDQLITDAKVDVASVNGDVLFSVGESTFVGFSLKHSQALPVSDKYRAETFFDGKPLGTYKFSVVPAGDGAPAKISQTETQPKS